MDAETAHLASQASSDSEKIKVELFTVSGATSSIDDSTVNPTLAKTWWKIDIFVLPVVAMFYFLSFLDRTNLANARVAGLQKDLQMSNYEFSIALTVTFIPYIAIEIPSNLVLKAVGPDLMLPTMLTLWGIVTTLQGFVKSYSGLLACRFFLGLSEGGMYPGLVLYLSSWYPPQHLQRRISAFFSTASLSGAFSGIIAYGIIHMDGLGHRPGWAWIFILEGLFTVVFGLSSFFILPRSPAHARFLNREEKNYVIAQLGQAGDTRCDEDEDKDSFSWREVGQAFTLPHMWMVAVAFFLNGTQVYGLAYFIPSILHGMGFSEAHAQLYSVPPFAAAFLVTMLGAYISDRYRSRGLVAMFAGILATTGFAMFLVSSSLHVKWGSLFLTATGAYNTNPTLSTWISNNTAPYTRRATSVALVVVMSNAGGILATWLLGTLSPAPLYRHATITLLIFSGLIVVITGLNIVYLRAQNREKAFLRATTSREDEKPGLGDRSAWFIYSL